jgi:hypothetical protein
MICGEFDTCKTIIRTARWACLSLRSLVAGTFAVVDKLKEPTPFIASPSSAAETCRAVEKAGLADTYTSPLVAAHPSSRARSSPASPSASDEA